MKKGAGIKCPGKKRPAILYLEHAPMGLNFFSKNELAVKGNSHVSYLFQYKGRLLFSFYLCLRGHKAAEFGTPRARTPMDFQRVLAFARSSFRLGILGKERFQYWYLLLWTLIRKPRLLPLAVTLAIYGHHFRKICDLYIL